MAISLGGAVVIGIGLLYTARSYRLARRGQVTDRFTKALERLGSPEPYVRIGGIYAIEHVLRESAEHHADTVEVLVNFVRHRVPHVRGGDGPAQSAMYPLPPLPVQPDTDVQIALDALACRPVRRGRERAHLHLYRLHLQGGWFSDARLQDADLSGAQLRDAHLDGAHLQGADLTDADLRGADLTGADLSGALLAGAQLHFAKLTNALLHGADLRGAPNAEPATGLTAQQLAHATCDASTALPEGLQRET